jgi:hypothetical protein
MEELINYWIKEGGIYEVIGRNITLGSFFNYLNISGVESKSRVDFILRSISGRRVALIEVRMSEHTGGRTAQQSLLDKIDTVLRLLEDPKLMLREKLLHRSVREVDLSIAILFSEDHELLSKDNFNRGRLTSLINYIMDERHVWGVVKDLSMNKGYKFCDGSPITREEIKSELSNPMCRKTCIQDSGSNLKIWLKILFGDEFFKEYIGSSLGELLAVHGDIIADDMWLFYTMAINELKIAAQFGQTYVRRIYDVLSSSNAFKDFVNKIYNNTNLSLDEYVHRFNQWIERCANSVIRIYKERNEDLRLLETNDVVASFEYLKQLCICALALYFILNYKGDREFKTCSWKVES